MYLHRKLVGVAFIGMVGSTAAIADAPKAAKPTPAEPRAKAPAPAPAAVDVEKLIASWPPRPVLAARQMMASYGPPQEATPEKLVWHDQGPYKRIVLTRKETPHDFPKPHMDYLRHTIAYRVPVAKAVELTTFDGSLTYDRTEGEMSAKCDLEGHNILTLNLAHDVITGKLSATEAREAFAKIVVDDMLGKHPPYVAKLQFEPGAKLAGDPDVPVIPGSPQRPGAKAKAAPEAEALGLLVAVNENEILAAMEAAKKRVSPEIAEYAAMLHTEHGMNLEATMKLGVKLRITPVETATVETQRTKGAVELARLVPLEGDAFGAAYIDAMVKGHTEVLAMIDQKLLKMAKRPQLKAHLTETRKHIAAHLAAAKSLQATKTARSVK